MLMDNEASAALDLSKPYNKIIYDAFEVVYTSEVNDKVKEMRKRALAHLFHRIAIYEKDLYDERLLIGIAEKKSKMLCEATSKTVIDRILALKAPHYNGAEFIPDEYSVPEEELIGWSRASLKAPLNSAASKRYFSLFKEIFPEEETEISLLLSKI